jgi:hypothetical protein
MPGEKRSQRAPVRLDRFPTAHEGLGDEPHARARLDDRIACYQADNEPNKRSSRD